MRKQEQKATQTKKTPLGVKKGREMRAVPQGVIRLSRTQTKNFGKLHRNHLIFYPYGPESE